MPFAPEDTISGLGFQDRSVAQTSFFTKSRLLYDFHCERDLLAMLQGSIVLSIIILDYPTDKDFQHWFYNSIRLFVKLDLHEMHVILQYSPHKDLLLRSRYSCSRQEDSCKAQKLYRRIWWVLYVRTSCFCHPSPAQIDYRSGPRCLSFLCEHTKSAAPRSFAVY